MPFQEKKQGKLCVFTELVRRWGETLGIRKKTAWKWAKKDALPSDFTEGHAYVKL